MVERENSINIFYTIIVKKKALSADFILMFQEPFQSLFIVPIKRDYVLNKTAVAKFKIINALPLI